MEAVWTSMELMTLDNDAVNEDNLKDFAFMSLIHMTRNYTL